MSNIVYVVSTLRRSGPTQQLLSIIRHLDKSRFSPLILTLSSEPNDSMKESFEALGIQVASLNLSRFSGMIWGRQKLHAKLATHAPTVIHSQGFRPDSLLASMNISNHVNSVRNDAIHDYPSKFGRLQGNWMASKHIRALRKLANPVAVSHHLAQVYKERHGINMRVIQNGVDTDAFSPALNKKELRSKLGLDSDTFLFVSIGSLIPRKDVTTLLNAFNLTRPKATLLILGDGPLRPSLEEVAKGNPQIRFLGQVSNVAEYLQASDAFISTSLHEGLPNTVLEAMSCGLPVLLSDIQSHRELVMNMNAPYWFAAVGDEQGFAKAIGEACSTLKPESTAPTTSIRNHVLTNFDSGKMSSSYQELYEDIQNDR